MSEPFENERFGLERAFGESSPHVAQKSPPITALGWTRTLRRENVNQARVCMSRIDCGLVLWAVTRRGSDDEPNARGRYASKSARGQRRTVDMMIDAVCAATYEVYY